MFHVTAEFDLQTEPASPSPCDQPVDLGSLSVLIVDDNAANQRIPEKTATGCGMRPTVVASRLAALEALRQANDAGQPFPLVLLDSNMPEMDGVAVVEQMRRTRRLDQSSGAGALGARLFRNSSHGRQRTLLIFRRSRPP